jgi:Zn-dependent protease
MIGHFLPTNLLAMTMPQPSELLAILLVIFFGIGLHEYAHAKAADMAGDPTPSIYGRVTLNLFKHFDPLGTIMIVITAIAGVGIGWGKPVPMDPRKMRNPKWDHFTAVLAGPITNLLQAGVYAILLRLLMTPQLASSLGQADATPFFLMFLLYGVLINIGLFLFNLLPIGPLDGMWILGTFLPESSRIGWVRWNLQYGSMLFLGIVIFSQLSPGPGLLGTILGPVRESIFRVLTGI